MGTTVIHQIPNLLTVLRILLTIPFIIFLFDEKYDAALLIFFVAAVTDGIDGYLARRLNCVSRFGEITDPLADKFLLLSGYILLSWQGHVSLWLFWLVLGRDILIIAGASAYYFLIGRFTVTPLFVSKLCTFLQILYLLSLFWHLSVMPLPPMILDCLFWSVGVVTLVSGLAYVWVWGIKVINQKRE